MIIHMLEPEFLEPIKSVSRPSRNGYIILLALSMEVYSFNSSGNLIEANIIKSFETRAVDRANSMIWHQKVFLPSHKNMFFLHPVLCDKVRARRVLCERFICRESSPVLSVDFLVRSPFGVLRYKGILISDYLSFEVRCKTRVVFR